MIELSENISEYILNVLGSEYLNNYKQFLKSNYPNHIRLSSDKNNQQSLIERLSKQGIKLEKVEFVDNAYEVKSGSDIIGKTIEYHLGKYYIQSLSSMIPPIILDPTEEDVVLDLCAAPGSKSTQLAEMMKCKGTLFANEPSLNRVKALIHNLDKMNTLNMRIIKGKGELLSNRFPEYFDKILVDAPCSALGVIQKKQEVSNWWSTKSVDKISSLQLRLLISAIKMTKVGGEIVYSTCTLTVEENEFIIDKVLKKYPVELIDFSLMLPHNNGYTNIGDFTFDDQLKFSKRIIPWEINSEGFFIAKLKKIESSGNKISVNPISTHKKLMVESDNKLIRKQLLEISDHFGINEDVFRNFKFLVNDRDINFTNIDSKNYNFDYFLRIGTKFGIVDKSNKLKLNSHAAQILGCYATKNIFNLTSKNEVEVYLSGGTIPTSDGTGGQKIIKYENLYLGTGVLNNNRLKSQFPRSKRTGAISVR